MSARAATNLRFRYEYSTQCWHHFLYTASILLNLCSLLYWPLVFPDVKEKYKDDVLRLVE